MRAPAWIRAAVDLPLRLVASLAGLVGSLVDARISELLRELKSTRARCESYQKTVARYSRALQVAREDRDKFRAAWKRCRDGDPAFDPGPPADINDPSPYGEP